MTTTPKPKGYWQQIAKLLAEQAKTMSNSQMADLHGVSKARMRHQLTKMGITPLKHDTGREARKAELAKLALTHTPGQIAKASGKSIRAIYQELNRFGIQAQPSIPGICDKRSIQLAEDAKTMTTRELAELYDLDLKYMHKLLMKYGITPKRARGGPVPKAKPVACDSVQPSRTPKLLQPAARMVAAIPSRNSIASKKPAEIVWPAHIRVQHIALPPPPADYRICNGSSRKAYVPAKGWAAGPRAI